MSKKVYRTAIYARLSKDDGDKTESNSIVSQKLLCEEYISRQDDLELVETYVDDGYSGVDFNRPDFRRMEKDLRDGKINAVVCKDLSRFSRNYIDGGRYLEKEFPRLGVRFIAINDNHDSLHSNVQTDSIVIPFKNLINDSYCKDISVKVRSNLDVKRRKGDYVGAFAPYGYLKDPNDKNKLVIDEYAGDIVKQIFSMYKDGMSIGKIAEKLNGLGVLSPMEYKRSLGINFSTSFKSGRSARWSYVAVKRILTNEIYIGVLTQGKRGTPNYKVHDIQTRDEEDWIRVEGANEPLVSYDDFVSVKNMLERDTRATGDSSEKNILSGFVFCADCGQPMIRKIIPSKGKKYYYYVCSSYKRHEGCFAHSISTSEVEKAVLCAIRSQIECVLDISETLGYLDKISVDDRSVFNYEGQIGQLCEEIEHYKKMKIRLYEDIASGVIDKKEYSEFKEQYSRMIDEKNAVLERVRKESKYSALNHDAERVWIALFREYQNIDSLNRRALMALIDKIYIHENHALEVSFRYGDEYKILSDLVKCAGIENGTTPEPQIIEVKEVHHGKKK